MQIRIAYTALSTYKKVVDDYEVDFTEIAFDGHFYLRLPATEREFLSTFSFEFCQSLHAFLAEASFNDATVRVNLPCFYSLPDVLHCLYKGIDLSTLKPGDFLTAKITDIHSSVYDVNYDDCSTCRVILTSNLQVQD